MKLNHPILMSLGGLLGTSLVRSWMRTLDFKAVYYDPAIDPAYPDYRGKRIFIFWHEYITFPLYLRHHCNLAMLLSRHRDADLLLQFARRLGFDGVRGSTNRGGSSALRKMALKSRTMNLTITPDGPRGPRRKLAPGAVYLASRLQFPIVAMGFGYDRPWRLNSWDRFAIPRPFSRARAVVSSDLHIPEKLDRSEIEHFRRKIERLLLQLSDQAETWAGSGHRKPGQSFLQDGPRTDALYFARPRKAGIAESLAPCGKTLPREY